MCMELTKCVYCGIYGHDYILYTFFIGYQTFTYVSSVNI